MEYIPLFIQPCLTLTCKLTTSIEFESPSPSTTTPFEVEVIDKSMLPHFNPPLLDTLDFVLQEVTTIDSVPISPHCIVMSSVSEN